MYRVLRWATLCCVALAFSASSLVAAGEGEGREKRRAEARKKWAERARRMREFRGVNMPLLTSEQARAELRRHRTALDGLLAEAQKLRQTVKDEVEAGAKLEEAVKNHLDEAKALAKKVMTEYATHVGNMAKIAKTEGDAAVDKLAETLLKGGQRERRQRREREQEGEGGKKPEAKEGENPFKE